MKQVQKLHADQGPTVADESWVARATKVAPIIAAAAGRIEQEKRVPDDVMSAMHDAQLFRMLLPRALGGGDATPRGFMDVLAIIAGADASAAWCLGQALGCSFAAAYLDTAEAKEVFGRSDSVVAWGPISPNAKAVPVDGGYRLTGRFRFASGSRNATWLGAHCFVVEPDGTPRAGPGGKPVARTFMFPIEKAKTHDVWQVIGLKGTGSDDYEVEDLFVPEGYTFVREVESELRDDWPIYRITFMNIYGIGFAAVSLGIARAMLDEFVTLAAEKIAYRTTAVLRENPVIQTQTAHAEWQLGASRAYLNEMVERHWQTACAGEEFSLDERTRLRLAISYAMNQAREVAEFAFRAAGTNAIFEHGPFERRFRDIQAVSQQSQANQWNFISAGEALLGLEPSGGRI